MFRGPWKARASTSTVGRTRSALLDFERSVSDYRRRILAQIGSALIGDYQYRHVFSAEPGTACRPPGPHVRISAVLQGRLCETRFFTNARAARRASRGYHEKSF